MLERLRVRAVVAAALAVAVVVSCSSSPEVRPPADHPAAGPSTPTPGVDETGMTLPDLGLRSDLEQLLGQHAFLTVQVMRARLRGDPDFAQATQNAVAGNTDDLTAEVTKAYGNAAGQRFHTRWQAQTLTMIDYAGEVSRHDSAGGATDRARLAGYVGSTAAFLSGATGGRLARSTASRALGTEATNLLTATDAYATGDFERAYGLEDSSYDHMIALGTALARAIDEAKTGTVPATFDGPVQRLSSALGADLGAHFEIAVDAMRAGYANAPDFDAAADTLNDYSKDLDEAFDVLFGEAAAKRFAVLWGNHVDDLVHYTAALAGGDGAGKQRALTALHTFEKQLGAFLSTSTQGRLTRPELLQDMAAHDTMLLDQINAFAAQDYTKVHAISFTGYQHMFVVGSALATAIGPTIAAKLPKGGVQTGGGGTAAG